jgi:hypothetical protein
MQSTGLQVDWFQEAQLDLGYCYWNSYIGVSFGAIGVCDAASTVDPMSPIELAWKPLIP